MWLAPSAGAAHGRDCSTEVGLDARFNARIAGMTRAYTAVAMQRLFRTGFCRDHALYRYHATEDHWSRQNPPLSGRSWVALRLNADPPGGHEAWPWDCYRFACRYA